MAIFTQLGHQLHRSAQPAIREPDRCRLLPSMSVPPSSAASPDKVLLACAGAGLAAASQAHRWGGLIPAGLLAVAIGAVPRHVARPLAAPAQAVGAVAAVVPILQPKGWCGRQADAGLLAARVGSRVVAGQCKAALARMGPAPICLVPFPLFHPSHRTWAQRKHDRSLASAEQSRAKWPLPPHLKQRTPASS